MAEEKLNVAIEFKLNVDDATKLEAIAKELPKFGHLHRARVEDFAFGIKVLFATYLMNDEKGGSDEMEGKLRGLDGVSEVEVSNVTRI
ncbi:MAG: elongation factor 1-beta [Candidatus Bilamarchaeaceae archaeon]